MAAQPEGIKVTRQGEGWLISLTCSVCGHTTTQAIGPEGEGGPVTVVPAGQPEPGDS